MHRHERGKELTKKEYEELLRQKMERVARWERYGIVPRHATGTAPTEAVA
jgi:hypothetical protein